MRRSQNGSKCLRRCFSDLANIFHALSLFLHGCVEPCTKREWTTLKKGCFPFGRRAETPFNIFVKRRTAPRWYFKREIYLLFVFFNLIDSCIRIFCMGFVFYEIKFTLHFLRKIYHFVEFKFIKYYKAQILIFTRKLAK